VIRKLPSGEYRLYSRKKDPKTGKRRNLGTFKTRAAAEKHELVRAQKRIEDEIATIETKIGQEEAKMSGSSDPGLLQDLAQVP
jgi:hypothetical protein